MFLGEGSIVAGLMPAVEAMAGGAPVRVGRFRFDVATTSWAWSDGMFRFHGFAPGDVVPTSELMAAQVYPEDSRNARQAVMTALADGEPFSCRQRIKDAAGRTRTVVVIGQGTRDRPGRVIELSGYYIAVTEQLRRDVAELAEQALDKAMESRAAIEQAKGALMLAYSVDEELAFDLLRWHSQHANIKVRELARSLVDRLDEPGLAALAPRRRIHAILAGIIGPVDVIPPALASPITAMAPSETPVAEEVTPPAGRLLEQPGTAAFRPGPDNTGHGG